MAHRMATSIIKTALVLAVLSTTGQGKDSEVTQIHYIPDETTRTQVVRLRYWTTFDAKGLY